MSKALLVIFTAAIAGACGPKSTAGDRSTPKREVTVRMLQPRSPATGAVYVQVVTSAPEAPRPVIELSVDGKRWSSPKVPVLNVRPDEYALLLDLERIAAPAIRLRAYPAGAGEGAASEVQVAINHVPNLVARYGFSKKAGGYVLDASASTDPDAKDSITKVRWGFDDRTVLEGARVKKPPRGERAPLAGWVQVFDAQGGVAQLHFILAAPSLLLADGPLAAVPPAEQCECVPGSLKFVTAGNSTLNPDPVRPLGSDYKVGDQLPLDAAGSTTGRVFLHAGFEVTAQVRYVVGEKRPCPEKQLAMRTGQNSETSFFRVFDGDIGLPYPFVDGANADAGQPDGNFGLDDYEREHDAVVGKRNPAPPHKLMGGDDDANAVRVVAKKHDGNTITWYDEPGVNIPAGFTPLVTGYSYKARFRAIVERCVATLRVEWDVDKYGNFVTQSMTPE